MSNRVYVGNLPYNFTSQDLEGVFRPHGVVRSAEVLMDRVTGRSRGFGFVELESSADVQKVIAALHDTDVGGRKLVVNEARERAPRGPGGPAGPGGAHASGGFGAPRGAPRGFSGENAPRSDRPERRDHGDREGRYSDGSRGRRRDDERYD